MPYCMLICQGLSISIRGLPWLGGGVDGRRGGKREGLGGEEGEKAGVGMYSKSISYKN